MKVLVPGPTGPVVIGTVTSWSTCPPGYRGPARPIGGVVEDMHRHPSEFDDLLKIVQEGPLTPQAQADLAARLQRLCDEDTAMHFEIRDRRYKPLNDPRFTEDGWQASELEILHALSSALHIRPSLHEVVSNHSWHPTHGEVLPHVFRFPTNPSTPPENYQIGGGNNYWLHRHGIMRDHRDPNWAVRTWRLSARYRFQGGRGVAKVLNGWADYGDGFAVWYERSITPRMSDD